MTKDELYIQRCFDLARLGAGQVSPNPMVGAVLVYENRIIGEGWHQRYGEAHAEVNAVASVKPQDRHLLTKATLYVSLEPCCIFGRTPPCTDLIIKNQIPKVVISCLDQTPGVAGTGVKILQAQGIEVITGVLEKTGQELSRFRNHFVTQNRPYIFLKYAQSLDGFIGRPDEQVWISNIFAKRLVHKWRSEVDAILVGTNTARIDNPQLTNRLYLGKSPLRIIFDRKLALSHQLNIFDAAAKTLIFTEQDTPDLQRQTPNVTYQKIDFRQDFLPNLLTNLHQRNITTLFVEGGAKVLQSFINEQLWDEALVFIGHKTLGKGIPVFGLPGGVLKEKHQLGSDQLLRFQKLHNR